MKSILVSLLACLILGATARAEFYLYTQLTAAPGFPYYSATGINNSGDVVGTVYDSASRPVAFRYHAGTTNIYPSPGPAHSTWGNAINATGTIVGMCDRNGSVTHAFAAAVGGSSFDFDGNFSRNSEAKAINDNDYVVGSVGSQAFLGHTGGWIYPLGSTLGYSFVASGLNNSWVIVGNGPWGGETYDAWTGTITYLGWSLGTWSNQAVAINDSGAVAGKVGSQGFVYTGGAVTYFGANVSEVRDINADGDVVGMTTAGHGFVYLKASGHFLDLNSVVASSVSSTWTIVSATGINDSGVICGQARRLATPADGPDYGIYVYRSYKLSPFIFIFTGALGG